MKLVVVKSNFSILLVPNYRVFRITVIYVMQQRKTKPSRTHEDIIIPDVMPRWPITQLEPNHQRCDHETYSVPACAEKEVANFVSLFIYDLQVCRPCMLLLHS